MLLINFLKKHFDVEASNEFNPELGERGRNVRTLYVYEKGEDCEYMFSLKNAQDLGVSASPDIHVVGNIYSNLEHETKLSEAQIKQMVRKNLIHSTFKGI